MTTLPAWVTTLPPGLPPGVQTAVQTPEPPGVQPGAAVTTLTPTLTALGEGAVLLLLTVLPGKCLIAATGLNGLSRDIVEFPPSPCSICLVPTDGLTTEATEETRASGAFPTQCGQP